jgi:arylsulfatase A-like enzyme/Tfp pilus assembly protein PilF
MGGFEPKPLNVIIVTADTLRADKLASYGNPRIATPNLDRLAASGVQFDRTTTVTPLTLPAHSSIFTGTYPMYHGVRDNGGYYLEPEQITLAEILKDQGYATGAFVAAFVLDSRWGLDQGFDRYFDDFDLSKFETISLDTVQRRGDEVLAEALTWLESVREKRFFSWIHFYDPHTPYEPPEPYLSQYEGVRWGRYDGEVAYVDSLMGELMEWLEAKELIDSTIVVFMGDHGESLGEHREVSHGFFVYDVTVAVPFILQAPYRGFQGRRVEARVRTIDLMPTLLGLLGLDVPEPVQGKSLVDLCTGRVSDLDLVAYSESLFSRHHYGWSDLKSLSSGDYQFIAAPRPELYDLNADPLQQNNLASERPDEVRRFENELQEILDRYSMEGIEDKQPQTLDPETQAQLAALGYIGGPSKINIDPSVPLADPKDKIELFNLIKQAGGDSSEDRMDEAFEKIRRVLVEDPDILEAHSILGNLHRKQGEIEEAIEAYKEALARDPEYKPALSSLATAYEEMGRLEDAAAGYRRVLELDPRDNRAHFLLAGIHAQREEFETALELLSKSVELGTERAPAHNLMAECYIGLEKFAEAEAEAKRAIEMKEDLPTAHYNLALALEELGETQEAIRAYEREIEITPENFKTHFNLAKLYGQVGRGDKQMVHFQKSIELNPDFAVGYLYLAKMHLDSGNLNEAMSLARKGIDLGPEPSMAPLGHFILADVYNRLGRPRDAEREVAIARRLQRS